MSNKTNLILIVIRKRLSHSYYDITRIKDDREKLRNFLFMTGVFINPENLEEKVPKVVKEFEEKNVALDEKNDVEKDLKQNILVDMLKEVNRKLDNNDVGEDLRENILSELEKVRAKIKKIEESNVNACASLSKKRKR